MISTGATTESTGTPTYLPTPNGTPVPSLLSYPVIDTGTRLAMQVRDYYKQLRGYVLRSETQQPKALTQVPGYCRLHFPYLSSPSKELVLVEDILSAEILAPYIPTAALLGSVLTSDQLDYLLSCGVRRVVFCLDEDASHKAIKQARKLRSVLNAGIVYCPKDPKDMTNQELTNTARSCYAHFNRVP